LSTPSKAFATPTYGTTTGIDYAGNKPSQVVRVGNIPSDTNPQVALSNDYGATWSANYAAPAPSSNAGYEGGTIAYSADGDTLLWSTSGKGVQISKYQASFSAVSALPSGAAIAADKVTSSLQWYVLTYSTFAHRLAERPSMPRLEAPSTLLAILVRLGSR
jgi:xyloglucan-specific exo-beta-1,4-glucanase